jgi:endonuclease/exonuclease/phosphatase family metal-dependent hydrolase
MVVAIVAERPKTATPAAWKTRDMQQVQTLPPAQRTQRRRPQARRVPPMGALVLALVPWVWFVVRDISPVMEGIAVVLPLLCGTGLVLTVALSALRRTRRTAMVVAASTALFTVVTVAGPRAPQGDAPPTDPIRLAVANMYESNPTPGRAAVALLDQRADLVAVVEGDDPAHQPFEQAYPHSLERASLSLHSRYELEELPPVPGTNPQLVLRARVFGPAGPFVAYVVHSENPLYRISFEQQLAFVKALTASASQEADPVVIAGDFNMTDRGPGYRHVTGEFRDGMRSGPAASTYDDGAWATLFLRIDHVFMSPDWCSADGTGFEVPGSDHDGVATSVGPCQT